MAVFVTATTRAVDAGDVPVLARFGRSDSLPPIPLSKLDRTGSRQLNTGTELLVVFVGSLNCGATRAPGLTEAMTTLRARIAREAALEGKEVVHVGVATDWSIQDGLRFLTHFGPFDEVVIGRNWLNSGAIRYIWHDFRGTPALPQILVLERPVQVDSTVISVGSERLLARKVGSIEIVAWATGQAAAVVEQSMRRTRGDTTSRPDSASAVPLGSVANEVRNVP